MKPSFQQTLAAVVGSAALMAIHPSALAEWTYDTLHGTACKPAGAGNAGIIASTGGISNANTVETTVLCPVMRTIPAPTTGYRVYVNGRDVQKCWLYSRASTGEPLWSALMTGSDPRRRVTALMPGTSPTQSSQVVECNLPPNGAIYSLEFVQ